MTAVSARHPGWYDVCEYGADPKGEVPSTVAFNAAVESASAAGGGTVYVPPGRFLSGTIYLKSNVTLHLEAGAALVGSEILEDYPENRAPEMTDTPEFRRLRHVYPARLEFGRFSLIHASGQHNVSVEGRGVIDGQGDHLNFSKRELVARGLTRAEAHFRRPYALSFVRCTNVQVRGVTFRNLAFWCQSYLDCEDVLVDGVTVDSPAVDRNNDGIDIDGCRRVRVVNSRFDTGDDAICLKATFQDCEDVIIANSVCSSLANGVKFGTASNGGFKNIAIANLTMNRIGAAGLALEVVDGGVIDGVVISNIVMNQVGAAIFIRLGDRGRTWMKPEHHVVGAIKNVSISNVFARVFTPYDGRPMASSITGLAGNEVENVTLSQVRIVTLRAFSREETLGLADAVIPECASDYPEYSMFGSLPAYGLYARHCRNLNLQDVEVEFAVTDHRSGLVCENVKELRIAQWKSRAQPGGDPVILLRDVHRAVLFGGSVPTGATTYLRVEGASFDISVKGIELNRMLSPVSLAPHLPSSIIRY